MPVYEYYCPNCDENYEVWHAASANGKQKCPTCKGKVEKVFHAPGIIFKGSGFHVNDYGSNGRSQTASTSTSTPTSTSPAATCPKAADKSCAGCEK